MRLTYLLAAALALAVPGLAAAEYSDYPQNETGSEAHCSSPDESCPSDPSRRAQEERSAEQNAQGGSGMAQDQCGSGMAQDQGGSGMAQDKCGSEKAQDQCGSGMAQDQGGAGMAQDQNDECAPPVETQPNVKEQGGAGVTEETGPATEISAPAEEPKNDHSGGKGLTIAATGGVEGYTSSLAPRIRAGPSWGLNLAAAPSRRVALELNYIGSNNRITDEVSRNSRIIRTAGNVDLKLALSPTPLEPYIFGGVGISRVTIRNEVPGSGYKDDTFGQVPLGAGINYHAGNFTAGARFTFNYLFDRNFTPPTQTGAFGLNTKQGGDIYDGQLHIGGTF